MVPQSIYIDAADRYYGIIGMRVVLDAQQMRLKLPKQKLCLCTSFCVLGETILVLHNLTMLDIL